MVKQVVKFICQQCSYESPSWLGKCPSCEEWNSLVETIVSTAQGSRFKIQGEEIKISQPLKLSAIKKTQLKRISTGIGEFDRVLGGDLSGEAGLVPGSVILLAGEPGIGKSTLLLQVADEIGRTLRSGQIFSSSRTVPQGGANYEQRKNCPSPRSSVLYISGEESAEQLKLRAQRLGIKGKNLLILEETNVEEILRYMLHDTCYTLIIIDSIQTLYSQELTGSSGSIGQVRHCTAKLFDIAKKTRIPMIFIGHITKGGMIAGPKAIEHLVDAVLYLEGERITALRILRGFKNRFGSTDEVGVFQMTEGGLQEVINPSQFFLEERQKKAPGSVITIALQGTRPILAEAESLVVPTRLAFPRRIASGIAFSRLQIICAILQKRLRMPLGGFDVYVSISGGLKITEPAADLAIALSIVSSYKNKVLTPNTVVVGELGLLGEIRKVPLLEKRIKEAKRLGYRNVLSAKTDKDLTILVHKLWS